jgi:cytochrome P450
VKTVQARLGHKSAMMTLNVYGHLSNVTAGPKCPYTRSGGTLTATVPLSNPASTPARPTSTPVCPILLGGTASASCLGGSAKAVRRGRWVGMTVQMPAAGVFDPAAGQFNPFLPGVMDDPYPYYRALRDHDPVHHNPEIEMYFLSRYHDVYAAGRDSQRFIRGYFKGGMPVEYEGTAIGRMQQGTIFGADEPAHGRLKGFIAKAFTRRPVAALQSRITELCEALLDEAGVGHGRTSLEVIAQYAYPLPFQVICELLGIPVDDRSPFLEWARKQRPTLDPFPTPQVVRDGIEGSAAFEGYLTAVLGERRRALRSQQDPPPGLITELVALAEESSEHLTSAELMSMAWSLLFAGFENVTNLIGNGVRALAEHPNQLRALREDSSLYENLTDEVLRYYTSPQYNQRETTEPVEVNGVRLPMGARVLLLRGSANRDERRFPDPDVFDLRRPDSAQHVSFGEGWTYCTGAVLTRLETKVAFRVLLARVGELAVTAWERSPSVAIWGPRRVDLEFAAPA